MIACCYDDTVDVLKNVEVKLNEYPCVYPVYNSSDKTIDCEI